MLDKSLKNEENTKVHQKKKKVFLFDLYLTINEIKSKFIEALTTLSLSLSLSFSTLLLL